MKGQYNMESQFSRELRVIGEEAFAKLRASSVIVFGAGGVGSYCIEALTRAGIGKLTVVDGDTYAESNLNRQLFATHATIGRNKAEVAKERILSINPQADVVAKGIFYMPENSAEFDLSQYSYIVDAIDNVTAKICLAVQAEKLGVPIISCMGTGNKLNPLAFRVDDIHKTSMCPLSRVMRRELRTRGVKHLKVVYSTEPPIMPRLSADIPDKAVPGSISFVPPTAGMIIAGEVIKDLMR